jgi:hypothetical protein
MRQVLHRLQSRHRQHAGDMCLTEQGLKLGSGEKMKQELESATSLRPVSECRGTVDLKVGILSGWKISSVCNFELMNVNKLNTDSSLIGSSIRQSSSRLGP